MNKIKNYFLFVVIFLGNVTLVYGMNFGRRVISKSKSSPSLFYSTSKPKKTDKMVTLKGKHAEDFLTYKEGFFAAPRLSEDDKISITLDEYKKYIEDVPGKQLTWLEEIYYSLMGYEKPPQLTDEEKKDDNL
jgi:hypothetical protein